MASTTPSSEISQQKPGTAPSSARAEYGALESTAPVARNACPRLSAVEHRAGGWAAPVPTIREVIEVLNHRLT